MSKILPVLNMPLDFWKILLDLQMVQIDYSTKNYEFLNPWAILPSIQW
jgi:hypothetical protein